MADVNPDDIPFVPDTSVSLIDTGSGKPKTAFHDWMSSIFSWMKRSVVDLTTKITTLTDTLGDTNATVEQLGQALTDGTGAYGSYITSIDTKADNATASGEIYFAAKSAPAGSAAAYGIYLTAGNYYTGLEMLATSGGGSAIGFTASQFLFTDSGTGVPIMSYSGGYYTFNANVKINGNLSIENGTVTVNNIALGAVGFNGAYANGTVVDLWPSASTAWVDYAAATLSPTKMGAGTFFFTYVGTAGSNTTDGIVTMEFRIVRRKSGVDTVMYGPIQYTGGPTPTGFEYFRWFSDQAGAGTVQYVCQFRFASQSGSSSGGTPQRRANYFRIDWQGADT